MQKILTSEQIRLTDQYTIAHEPIASIALMERASRAFTMRFMEIVPDQSASILICAGTGNNGGDGLAVARMLHELGYLRISVWIARFSKRETADFMENLRRLKDEGIVAVDLLPGQPFPPIQSTFVIDALLGTGLNKPLEGEFLRLVHHINAANIPVIAVDIPTGLPGEGPLAENGETVFACETITFQRPKLAFFFPESARSLTRFHVVPIGLDDAFMDSLPSNFTLVERSDIMHIYRKRAPFSHKGTYGHALIVAGKEQTMGAALLSTGASIYTGSGLTTASIPGDGLIALNTTYPEAMYLSRKYLSEPLSDYKAIGIGPGLGHHPHLLEEILKKATTPMVIDADALNMIAANPALLHSLPETCVLTPHAKEFDRIFGTHTNWWERVDTARRKATELEIVIVLKNRFTFIATPEGKVWINPTGNPAMASGGMGDVLTGMITSFLAQGYSAVNAAIMGCYLHGAAGDHLARQGMSVIPASVLLKSIPETIAALEES